MVAGYNVSKIEGEKAAWDFMETNKPAFDLTVINPDVIAGPMVHLISGPKSISKANHFAIVSFLDGTHKEIEGVAFPLYHFVCSELMKPGEIELTRIRFSANSTASAVNSILTPDKKLKKGIKRRIGDKENKNIASP
jgi:hypothetical protein